MLRGRHADTVLAANMIWPASCSRTSILAASSSSLPWLETQPLARTPATCKPACRASAVLAMPSARRLLPRVGPRRHQQRPAAADTFWASAKLASAKRQCVLLNAKNSQGVKDNVHGARNGWIRRIRRLHTEMCAMLYIQNPCHKLMLPNASCSSDSCTFCSTAAGAVASAAAAVSVSCHTAATLKKCCLTARLESFPSMLFVKCLAS